MTATVVLPGLSYALTWLESPALPPVTWSVGDAGVLRATAPPRCDWFLDPAGGPAVLNAPTAACVPREEAFSLSMRVAVDFRAKFDAAALVARVRDDLWAKLCFEYSPQGEPMVVSVVTRGRSDDCNAAVLPSRAAYLRLSLKGPLFAMHWSPDGRWWNLARYGTLGEAPSVQLGLLVQSPTGDGCQAEFSEVAYRPTFPADLRNGQ